MSKHPNVFYSVFKAQNRLEAKGKVPEGKRTFSSVGRATDSYSVGPGFESLKVHQQPWLQPIQYRRCVGSFSNSLAAVRVFSGEGPPVPIPNTVVKITCADNT